MAMDPQEKRTWIKVGFIFVFFLAAILAMPKMGFYSRVNEYKETEKKREKVSKAFDDSKTKVKELPGLEKKIAQMESDIAYFERRLPNDPDAPELFDLLKRGCLHFRWIEIGRVDRQFHGIEVVSQTELEDFFDRHLLRKATTRETYSLHHVLRIGLIDIKMFKGHGQQNRIPDLAIDISSLFKRHLDNNNVPFGSDGLRPDQHAKEKFER